MAFKTRRNHGDKHADSTGDQDAGEDLRDEQLDQDVAGLLDEIDCCLAGHADQEAAGQRAKDAAEAEYKAIRAACGSTCRDFGVKGCPHTAQIRVWAAAHAGKFFWCCGKPVFDKDEAAAMESTGAGRGLGG